MKTWWNFQTGAPPAHHALTGQVSALMQFSGNAALKVNSSASFAKLNVTAQFPGAGNFSNIGIVRLPSFVTLGGAATLFAIPNVPGRLQAIATFASAATQFALLALQSNRIQALASFAGVTTQFALGTKAQFIIASFAGAGTQTANSAGVLRAAISTFAATSTLFGNGTQVGRLQAIATFAGAGAARITAIQRMQVSARLPGSAAVSATPQFRLRGNATFAGVGSNNFVAIATGGTVPNAPVITLNSLADDSTPNFFVDLPIGHGDSTDALVGDILLIEVSANDPNQKLLLHMDGVEGSQAFVDSSLSSHTITANHGYRITNGVGRFSGAGAPVGNSDDYIFINETAPPDFTFGTGSFSIDFVMFATANTTGMFYDARPNATNGIYPTLYYQGGVIKYLVNSVDQIVGTTTVSLSALHHVALVRDAASGNTKLFLDGVQEGSTYVDGNNYLGGGNTRPLIGNDSFAAANPFVGALDEFRVSKGVARWTANFIPPSVPYAGSGWTQYFSHTLVPVDFTGPVMSGSATALVSGDYFFRARFMRSASFSVYSPTVSATVTLPPSAPSFSITTAQSDTTPDFSVILPGDAVVGDTVVFQTSINGGTTWLPYFSHVLVGADLPAFTVTGANLAVNAYLFRARLERLTVFSPWSASVSFTIIVGSQSSADVFIRSDKPTDLRTLSLRAQPGSVPEDRFLRPGRKPTDIRNLSLRAQVDKGT